MEEPKTKCRLIPQENLLFSTHFLFSTPTSVSVILDTDEGMVYDLSISSSVSKNF